MHPSSRLEDEQKFCTICAYYFLPVPLRVAANRQGRCKFSGWSAVGMPGTIIRPLRSLFYLRIWLFFGPIWGFWVSNLVLLKMGWWHCGSDTPPDALCHAVFPAYDRQEFPQTGM